MKFKNILFLTLAISFASCKENSTTQVSENTFVYKDKVYKVIGNQLTELADLNSKNIIKLDSLKPKQIHLGEYSLSYIKEDASANLDALYRGNYFYFKLSITNFNDLRESYMPGRFTINFEDEYGFTLNSIDVLNSDLIGILDDNKKVGYFEYYGKIEMNSDITSAIKSYRISSTIKHI